MAELSPEEWLKRLAGRLHHERPEMEKRDDYYRGVGADPEIPDGARAEFGRFLEMSRAPFIKLTVDALVDRLSVDRFATGEEQLDRLCWETWTDNRLAARQTGVYVDQFVKKRGYAMLWRRPNKTVRITVEDPKQVIHEHDAEDTDKVVAALKMWTDDLAGQQRANVYIRGDGIYKFFRSREDFDPTSGWERLPKDDKVEMLPGVPMPVYPFINRADVNGYGQSEIDDAIPVQDRINKTLFDRVVATEFGAFRQKWATGLAIPVDPETNQPIDTFEAAIKRYAINENPSGKFGTFDSTDLLPYLATVEQDLVLMARIGGVPPHYLTSKGEFPSGDALRSAEAPLIAKANRKMELAGDVWETVMRDAMTLYGFEARPSAHWRNPETRTFGEAADWFLKIHSAAPDVPVDLLLARIGFSADELREARENADASALIRGLEELEVG